MVSIRRTLLFLFFFISFVAHAEVRLPKLVSDGMVLQRETKVKIWGWAEAGEKISIDFLMKVYQTSANENGEWEMMVPTGQAGGPHAMTVEGNNKIILHDIMIGDVWICSGQSNMELPMRRVQPLYEQEIRRSENNFIRYFEVPKEYDFNKTYDDLTAGRWEKPNPEEVLHFSAVAYFFAKYLYEKYKIPIGLINSSLGGSPAEAWMSEEALKAFPEHYQEAQRFKDSTLIAEIEQKDQQRSQAWYGQLQQKDQGSQPGKKKWYDPGLNTNGWATMQIPGYWATTELGAVNGVVWFRKDITIPPEMAEEEVKLNMGRIVDADSVFINGKFVGTTSYQYPPRWYDIPEGVLKAGQNTITVRVISERGEGGFVADKPYELTTYDDTVDLKGDWKYKLSATMQPLESQTFIRWKPVGLYQAMIAPLLNYHIKGTIWYQGESNTDRPKEYAELFPAMIKDWRNHWQQGDFPFLFVQLANFMEAKDEPSESNWAELREAQTKTLAIPNTAMAVTIDIGEWNDIHPLDKKDVAKRLALAAEKIAYGEDVVHSGPMFQSMKVEGNKIMLSFSDTGSGLEAKGDTLKGFAIAGIDGKFVWADAEIQDEHTVVVWNDAISDPKAVRYAWADNPEHANLYNSEGLPASPFRTDK